MTKAASSNSLEEVSPQSPSCSSSTSSTEVYNSPLGQGGEIFVNDEKFDLATIGSLASPYATASNILVSNNEGVTKIGTVDFHINSEGPTEVKINHYAPAQELKENGLHKNAGCSPHPRDTGNKENQREICVPIACILSVVLVLIGVIVWAELNQKYNLSTEKPSSTTTAPDYGFFISREEWGAKEPKSAPTSVPPALLAVIKHTGGNTCGDNHSCITRVRQIQQQHMEELLLPDISYNFLIGGDGKIYFGRGWGIKNEGRNDSLDIAFIGNFTKNVPSKTMLSSGRRLLVVAPKKGGLNYSKYFVVNDNQTKPTDSPGENLFRVIYNGEYNHYCSAVCYSDSEQGFVIEYDCPKQSNCK